MKPFLDLAGKQFGRLVAQWPAGRVKRGNGAAIMWLTVCECGRSKVVRQDGLTSGHTASCGCLQPDKARQTFTTHGLKGSRTHKSWHMMIQRCTNPNVDNYTRYGGRGIQVCQRWRDSFASFLADMGERPEGKTLDRFPNNGGNYEPGNCRWATPKEQAQNRRTA